MNRSQSFMQRIFIALVCIVCCTLHVVADDTTIAVDTWKFQDPKSDTPFGGGDGSEANPYLIQNAQQLANLSYKVKWGNSYKGKYFKLTRDIRLNNIEFDSDHNVNTKNLNDLEEWIPIGDHYSWWDDNSFEGNFNGDGHTIYGLAFNIDRNVYIYQYGLFGAIKNASITNLNIKDSYLGYYWDTESHNAGFFVGYLSSSMLVNCNAENCHIQMIKPPYSKVYDEFGVGGLVGQGSGKGKVLDHCSFKGTIRYTLYRSEKIAGLMGFGSADIKDCNVDCTFYLTNNVGSKNLYVNGVCYEAESINNVACNADFVFDCKNDDHSSDLQVYSICNKAKSITSTIYTGSTKFVSTDGYKSITIGNVGTADNIAKCAFYNNVMQTEPVGMALEMKYYPLCTKKATSVSDVVLLDGIDNISADDAKVIKKQDIPNSGDASGLYCKSIADLKDNSAFIQTLNHSEYAWGKNPDVNSKYYKWPWLASLGADMTDVNYALKGSGTDTDPYIIGSEADWRYFSDNAKEESNYTQNKYFKLNSDIDMSSSDAVKTVAHFNGTFDGNGHIISGATINGSGLFGVVNGTVKNMAMLGATINATDVWSAPLVSSLKSGSITDCYVGGDIKVNSSLDKAYIGGLCGICYSNCNITNSYFKGNITTASLSSENIGGICGLLHGTVNHSYASFSVSTKSTNKTIGAIYGTSTNENPTLTDCHYVCDDNGVAEQGTKHSSDKDLLNSYTYDEHWAKGAYRPVLKNACHYNVTAADGSDTKAYYDAIPVTDTKNSTNDIYHLDADGRMDDKLMWALPNVAIYNSEDNSEYILNCKLDPSKPFNYNAKTGREVDAVNVNMHYPLSLKSNKNYYMLCLPGTVNRDILPDGGKLLIGGKILTDSDNKKYINFVDADSVAAGVPFVAYIPDDYTKDHNALDFVMRSRMATSPLKKFSYGDTTREFGLTGTFTGTEIEGVRNDVGGIVFKNNGTSTVAPFSSYLESDESVELRDHLLLMENGSDVDNLLNDYNGQESNVVLIRTLNENKWNTICLPFDMTADDVKNYFADAKVDELTSVTASDNGGCTLTFSAVTDGMKAGHCYLIKPSQYQSAYHTLPNRTINSSLATPEDNNVTIDDERASIKFCGTFQRTILGHDKSEEYFIQGDKIYHVANGQEVLMAGFRCYFTLSASPATAANVFSNAHMVHSDGTATSIRLAEVGTTANGERIYDLQGIEQNVDRMQRGVYIKNGRKFISK